LLTSQQGNYFESLKKYEELFAVKKQYFGEKHAEVGNLQKTSKV
jgi:hypothetical protein